MNTVKRGTYKYRGHTMKLWVPEKMPRIRDELLECSIYLYRTRDGAVSGEQFGGSGFLVGVPLVKTNPPCTVLEIYAVTNAHIVIEGRCEYIRFNTMDGGFGIYEAPTSLWTFHEEGDDLAVLALDLPDAQRTRPLLDSYLINDHIIRNWKIGPGDDTFMVGRFINHEGKQKNTPSVRFGSISMMPLEPIKMRNRIQEAFLVEARSISGYSGSPVFVHLHEFLEHRRILHIQTSDDQSPAHHERRWLLGIDCGHSFDWERIKEEDHETETPDGRGVTLNTGLSCVIPAWRLRQLLDSAPLVDDRLKHWQEFIQNANGPVQLD